MKQYLIIVRDKNVLKELNDKIAVDSLFSLGETITNSPLLFGDNYTNDKRVYESAKEFSRTHESVFAHDLSHFVYFGYNVVLTDGFIAVNGFKLPLRIKSGYIANIRKTYISTSDISRFGGFILDDNWIYEVKDMFEHIIKYGKKVTTK